MVLLAAILVGLAAAQAVAALLFSLGILLARAMR